MCSGVPRFELDGSFVGYIASCVDITELKRSQEVALARQKLESLGVLAGGIAHDFNNLLCGIMADSELLMDELQDNPSAQESLQRIDAIAIRASEVVRQLMVYAGQESAEFNHVDLTAVLNEMLQMMRLSISKNATFKVDIRGKLPPISANATQIRQVIMNLLTNASEALGGKEGEISVRLEQVCSDRQSAIGQEASLLPGNYLRLEVSDSGCGMTEEVVAGIFDPFFTTKGAGRGLGLSAVQGIVRSHGGNISVISAPGQGSCFEVLLPCLSQAESPSKGAAMETSPKENGTLTGAVLLIEDEDAIRLAVAKMLRRKGFSVLESGDGRAAVELFRAHASQIEAVLLDVTLPVMSGREVLHELRKTRPAVKVILTSAYGRDHALEAVGGDQSEPYIRKPYQLDQLAETIRRICLGEPANHLTTERVMSQSAQR
jgi:nitrogen-specific signal transduction histidine kinase/CheY-like chemotaxis protein